MKQIKIASVLIGFMIAVFSSSIVSAETALPPLLISEVQTGGTVSANEEFIELVNTTDQPLDASKVKVEYFSAAATSFDKPTRTILLHGILTARSHYLLASTGYLLDKEVNDNFSSGLAANGGHIRIINADTNETYDTLGWGTAIRPETKAATIAASDQSLHRKTENNVFVDTNNNFTDFESRQPSPTGYVPSSAEPDPEPNPDTPENPATEEPGAPSEPSPDDSPVDTSNLVILITELLPNPATPQTDAQDEYVELYNPNDQVVNLKGYKLQTGLTYNHSFTFSDVNIAPFSYQAFYSSETKASLSNTGGKARLIAPSGETVSETEAYGSAADGRTWAWDGSTWQWTTTPSPGALNVLNAPVVVAKKPTSTKASSTKAKTSSTKTTKPKVAKAKAVKGAKTTSPVLADTTADTNGSGVQSWLLAGVGGLAVLYGAYEYRSDLANFFRKFRFYRKNSGETGKES